MNSNRHRFLSEVVAVDAWHSPIRIDRNATQVSVELTFKEGQMGGDDPAFPFTFVLSLKRATLTIFLEEPLFIDRRSVARDIPQSLVEQSQITSIRETARGGLSAGVNLSQSAFSASAKAHAGLEHERKKTGDLKFVQSVPPITATGEPAGTQEYKWSLEASYLESLIGQPWDPVAHPRLSARYDPSKINKIEPAIRVEISCRFQDIVISEISPKDNSLSERIKTRIIGDPRIAAANQFLKKTLVNLDLEAGSMDNRFSSMILANVMSVSEPDS